MRKEERCERGWRSGKGALQEGGAKQEVKSGEGGQKLLERKSGRKRGEEQQPAAEHHADRSSGGRATMGRAGSQSHKLR